MHSISTAFVETKLRRSVRPELDWNEHKQR